LRVGNCDQQRNSEINHLFEQKNRERTREQKAERFSPKHKHKHKHAAGFRFSFNIDFVFPSFFSSLSHSNFEMLNFFKSGGVECPLVPHTDVKAGNQILLIAEG
jgi:hypothetical protein